MIGEKINGQIKEALKAGDQVRLSTLRLLSDALHNEWIAKQKELTEEEELAVVRRQAKMREEAIAGYQKGGRAQAAEKEKQELKILKEFLPARPAGGPAQMNEAELGQIVEQTIKETGTAAASDFGKVMGQVMQKVAGRADGKAVAETVKKRLESR